MDTYYAIEDQNELVNLRAELAAKDAEIAKMRKELDYWRPIAESIAQSRGDAVTELAAVRKLAQEALDGYALKFAMPTNEWVVFAVNKLRQIAER